MRLQTPGALVAAIIALGITSACGTSSNGGGSAVAGSTASGSSAVQSAPPSVPMILVHGINSVPADWGTIVSALAPGRTTIPAIYAADAEALPANSLSPDVVVAFGYYQDSAAGPQTEDASIGGCPVARTDSAASLYTESYADRLRRCVDGILNATGSNQVDLVCHSMGGLVGRAYTRWLSLDANGHSKVRRVFTIASPARGVNALEATVTAVSEFGPVAYMRQGECLELCSECDFWGGESFVAQLNGDWDGFCASQGIEYAGISLLGAHGVTPGLEPTAPNGIAPPADTTAPGWGYLTGMSWSIVQFMQGIMAFTPTEETQLPLLPYVVQNLPAEMTVALQPSDGTVRFSSSRLDEAPFQRTVFFGQFEGTHANFPDPERGFASTYAIECIRAFCQDTAVPSSASFVSLTLTPERAPGRATWLAASVDVTGDRALEVQLVEEPLDASGQPIYAEGYGAPVRPGGAVVPFIVPAGGGTRQYRVVVYGPSGELAVQDGVQITLDDGALETAPLASVLSATAQGSGATPSVSIALGSNAAPSDTTAVFRTRLDGGAWSDWSATPQATTPPLAPGIHRFEVVLRDSSNAAGMLMDQLTPTLVSLHVDGQGGFTLVR